MAELKLITPFVMTHDLDVSLSFFMKTLEFECGFRMDNYAFIHHKGHGIRLLEVEPSCDIGEQMIYLDVDDVDALYATLKSRLNKLASDRVRAPFDQPYLQREFHVKDPDNCLLMFGTDISSRA